MNEGPDPITTGTPAVSGPDASAFPIMGYQCGGTLYTGDACTVFVAFVPARLGLHTAALDVPVEGEEPLSIPLSGEGVPWLRVTPTALDFGTLPAFTTSQAQEVIVENTSGQTLGGVKSLLTPRVTPFRLAASTCDGATLAPGATCRVSITLATRRAGTAEGRLAIWANARELASVPLRAATQVPVSVIVPPGDGVSDASDASAHLGRRLRLALARVRAGGGARAALLRRGLVVRGIVPPARGTLALVVRARRSEGSPATLVAVRRGLRARADEGISVRARLTRAGRRLLNSGRPVILDVTLTLVARSDKLVSSAERVLRLARAPDPAGP